MITIVLGSTTVLEQRDYSIIINYQLNFNRNHRYFLLFISIIWFYLLWMISTLGTHIYEKDINNFSVNLVPTYIDIDTDTLYIIKIVLSGIIMLISIAFICPLS